MNTIKTALRPVRVNEVTGHDGEILEVLTDLIPGLDHEERWQPCPNCGDAQASPANMIIHLNDSHGSTFLEIADWLDTQDLVVVPPLGPLRGPDSPEYFDEDDDDYECDCDECLADDY